jgi:hypothetical protein
LARPRRLSVILVSSCSSSSMACRACSAPIGATEHKERDASTRGKVPRDNRGYRRASACPAAAGSKPCVTSACISARASS